MTPEQWKRVRDIFEGALDAGRADREWVARQANDALVEGEVLSLLANHERAGLFLSEPAIERMAATTADEGSFKPGEEVGSYVIARELGRGGMGRVYLATDSKLGREVALKVLDASLAASPSQRQRLRREARAAAQLSHPGICTVYALEEVADDIIIAAEYIDGKTLRAEIDAGQRPPGEQVERTMRELVSALAAAHARGITHRDLKPENVMRDKKGSIKILDFGLALVDDEKTGLHGPRVTMPGAVVGTPAYMAPEQIAGGAADARTDLFALGVLMFEYATGVHPFDAPTAVAIWARVLEGQPTPLAGVRQDLSSPVVAAIMRCLERDPARRFANAQELLVALDIASAAAAQPVERGSVGWWRTHMITAIGLYALAAAAVWGVSTLRLSWAGEVFMATSVLATIGGVWRGHLLFAERTHERTRALGELRRAVPVLTFVDLALALMLVTSGVRVVSAMPVVGSLIAALGIGIALARLVLERVTTEAAFDSTGG